MSIINTVNDSDVVYGSRQVIVGAQTYETSDFDLSRDVKRFIRESSKGIANGRVSILTGDNTGTTTLHYPSSAVPAPVFGNQFIVTISGVVLNCTITKVGDKATANGETMIPCSFDVNIGTIVTSTQT